MYTENLNERRGYWQEIFRIIYIHSPLSIRQDSGQTKHLTIRIIIMNQDKKLYTPKEVAEMFGLKPKYVNDLIRQGILKAKVIGKFKRSSQEDINSFMANLDDSSKGGKRIDEKVRNIIKYHAKLRSKDNTPKVIQKMSDRISEMKENLRTLADSDKKIPVVAKFKSTISAKVENEKKMEAFPAEIEELSEQAYPGMRDYVDEDIDALEEVFTREAQGEDHETPQAEIKSKESGEKEPKTMMAFHRQMMGSEEK
ncbi:MAG: helix-turn-helix domain-containing protein [Desulfobacterales bacterium]